MTDREIVFSVLIKEALLRKLAGPAGLESPALPTGGKWRRVNNPLTPEKWKHHDAGMSALLRKLTSRQRRVAAGGMALGLTANLLRRLWKSRQAAKAPWYRRLARRAGLGKS